MIQVVWASAYVSQKMALAEMTPGLILILRYGIAVLFFLLAGQYGFKQKFSRKEWLLILGVGVLNFSGSPYFQLKALTYTYAVDVSVMVAFEPLVSALLAVYFLRERMHPFTLLTFGLAILGVLIMSLGKGSGGTLQWFRLWGDSLFLISLLCEGACSITSRHLTQRHSPLRLIAWMILAGFTANLLGNFPLLGFSTLTQISPAGWLNLVWLGFFCSVFCYWVWFSLIQRIPVNQIALSLFLQPILGSALAVVLLKEKMDGRTILGSAFILLTLLIWVFKRRTSLRLGGPQQQNGDVDLVPDLGRRGPMNEVREEPVSMG
ncbi:MAG: DMT family transporter [Deltaproteobacteria bacterium]|nr:DMT family transporter [Deltaproteobacteria bacterium]